jgi:hypothetical protein
MFVCVHVCVTFIFYRLVRVYELGLRIESIDPTSLNKLVSLTTLYESIFINLKINQELSKIYQLLFKFLFDNFFYKTIVEIINQTYMLVIDDGRKILFCWKF